MTESINTPQSASSVLSEPDGNNRLWLEFGTTVVAWLFLNCVFSVISWLACVHREQFGGPSPNPTARVFYSVVWAASAAVVVLVGRASYRSWRRLSQAQSLLEAEGRERREFMSLSGLFISFTLGFGCLWMVLPLFMLQMCVRTR
jgi:hypothetical protein